MPKKDGYLSIEVDFLLEPGHRILKRISYKSASFKSYFNAQHLLYRLNPLERTFLEYLIENADEVNRVYVDKIFKGKYISFHDKVITVGVPTLNQLNKAVVALKELGLILEEDNGRALYRINPKYFWVGGENSRMELLTELVVKRAKNKLPINHLIDISVGDFLKPEK